MNNLKIKIQEQEDKLKADPGLRQARLKITKLQHDINCLLNEEIAKKILYTKHNFFENANKPTRWLAYKLKPEKKRRFIRTLKNEQGVGKSGLEDLKGIAKRFNAKLYSRQMVEPDTIKNYLSNNQNIKKLNEQQKKDSESGHYYGGSIASD